MIDSAPLKWVWMDLDDTLIDFRRNSRVALGRLYTAENLCVWYPTADEWIESYEKVNKPLWKRYSAGEITVGRLRLDRFLIPLLEGGMEEDEALTRARRYDTYYLDLLAEEKAVLPGAHEVLRELREMGYGIGILSNGFSEVQHRKIASAGLDGLVDTVVLSDDIGVTKPDIRLYEYAMRRVGSARSSEHLMVGDNLDTDIQGAINAGWQAVYFSPSRPQDSPTVVSDLRELPTLLRRR